MNGTPPLSLPAIHAMRYGLGLRLVKGLAKDEAGRLAAARLSAYQTVQSLITIADISVQALQALAAADAFTSLGLDARQAGWQIKSWHASVITNYHYLLIYLHQIMIPASTSYPQQRLARSCHRIIMPPACP